MKYSLAVIIPPRVNVEKKVEVLLNPYNSQHEVDFYECDLDPDEADPDTLQREDGTYYYWADHNPQGHFDYYDIGPLDKKDRHQEPVVQVRTALKPTYDLYFSAFVTPTGEWNEDEYLYGPHKRPYKKDNEIAHILWVSKLRAILEQLPGNYRLVSAWAHV